MSTPVSLKQAEELYRRALAAADGFDSIDSLPSSRERTTLLGALTREAADIRSSADELARAPLCTPPPARRLKCTYEGCEATLKSRATLKIHEQTHTGVRRFSCGECGAAFALKFNLQTHETVHTGEKRYRCEKCDHACNSASHLTRHVRTHDEARAPAFSCDICDAAFVLKDSLSRHIRLHTEEKMHVCDFAGCEKAFMIASELSAHKRVHTGARPFVCEFVGCGATYRWLANLIIHRRTHTGERPYLCPFVPCKKTFTSSTCLVIHLQLHGQGAYSCDECGAPFARRQTLVGHKRTHTAWAWKSKGEEAIYRILETLLPKDAWDTQVTFADCLNPETKCRLRYDFGVPMGGNRWILIEFNGYCGHVVPHPLQGEAAFKAAQHRYAIKRKYALDHGHILLEIDAKDVRLIEAQVQECLADHGVFDDVE